MWGGGRCLPFGWKFQSKTGITIRFGASSEPRHSNLPPVQMMKTMLMTSLLWENVFFFFWEKTGNITGYRCYPGGRKELLVVHLVVQ